jgi:hypothetical protein
MALEYSSAFSSARQLASAETEARLGRFSVGRSGRVTASPQTGYELPPGHPPVNPDTPPYHVPSPPTMGWPPVPDSEGQARELACFLSIATEEDKEDCQRSCEAGGYVCATDCYYEWDDGVCLITQKCGQEDECESAQMPDPTGDPILTLGL